MTFKKNWLMNQDPRESKKGARTYHAVEEGDVKKTGIISFLNLIILIGGVLIGGGILIGTLQTEVKTGFENSRDDKKEILAAIKDLSGEMRIARNHRNDMDKRLVKVASNYDHLEKRMDRERSSVKVVYKSEKSKRKPKKRYRRQ